MTTGTEHTPGPWTHRDEQDSEEVWIGVPGQTIGMKVIATVQYGFTPPANVEQQANARLIAAAPELLALCRDMKKWLEPELIEEPDRAYFWKLVEVIRKAEGKVALFEVKP